MDADQIAALFTRSDGAYAFARWGRPLAPVAFGIDDATLGVVKGAIEATAALARHPVAQTDPELGANLMLFFVRDWEDLAATPNLDRLVPDLPGLLQRLADADANQYRIFRFDAAGGILACFVFLRMDAHLSAVPAETLALAQVVQSMLLWSDTAFNSESPLARLPSGAAILRPEIGDLVRVAYDPVLPVAADDPAHALRLAARMGRRQ